MSCTCAGCDRNAKVQNLHAPCSFSKPYELVLGRAALGAGAADNRNIPVHFLGDCPKGYTVYTQIQMDIKPLEGNWMAVRGAIDMYQL